MSFANEDKAIVQRFETNWADATEIVWDNLEYTPSTRPYVRLIIHNGEGYQANIGTSPTHRFAGVISINIHGDPETGTRALKTLADTAATIFRSVQFSSITCRTPSITRLGKVDDEFIYNVSVSFYRDTHF